MMNGILKLLIFCLFLAAAQTAGADAPQFDHRHFAWNQFLQQLTKDGRVNYGVLSNNPAQLNIFLESVGHVLKNEYEGWNREQKIAFWINAYNAAVIKTVVDHYPLEKGLSWKALAYPSNSIQQIPDVWDRPALDVFGAKVSLNYIEHEVLRKEFKDPRIHFALVCASLGCPILRSEPYVSERLDTQLDDQIRRFLADPKKAHYDSEAGTLNLSPIFKWFREDFEKAGGIVQFVKPYLPQEFSGKISADTKIEWLDYDWSLNERNRGS